MDPSLENALAAHRAGRLEEAAQLYRRIIEADGRNFPALHMLGFLEGQRGRYDEAVRLLGLALELNPADPEALAHHAHALMAARRHHEALAAYDRLLARAPDHAEALYNRGVILSDWNRPAKALASFDRALAVAPDTAAIHYSRGVVLAAMNRQREALDSYDRALSLQPNLAMAAGNRAMAALNLCDWTRTAQIGGEIAALVARGIAVPPQVLLGYSADRRLQLQGGRNMIRALIPQRPAPLWNGERYGHDRIRLGYVSPDFRDHAVAQQIAPLIESHDRGRFEAIAFSLAPGDGSAMRARMERAFDQFHDVGALAPADIARRMRAAEIDIAIDLAGHTGGARPAIFAFRPAPVQVAWLGYPATTGADFMDYLIADRIVAPQEHQPDFAEKLVHLPHSFFPTDAGLVIGAPPTRAQAGLPDDGFIFCCFNTHWKITAALFDVWMRLLSAVPGSTLWLKQPDADARTNLERAAAARGVAPHRLVFAPDAPLETHLARHALADLFLDTLPYNAHATAAHALWAGLPVLTCRGEAFAGRVAASLLEAAGAPELVTQSLADYEGLALRLAREPDRLPAIREKLARRHAPLFDGERFRKALESAFAGMMETGRAGA